jgi:hypothetical protein
MREILGNDGDGEVKLHDGEIFTLGGIRDLTFSDQGNKH